MKYRIYNQDVMEWAKAYSKAKFHALLSDPPYHLTSIVKRFGKPDSAPAKYGTDGVFSRYSKGFMGQTWDGGEISFQPETWAALADHLYDGAFGMAFSSSRNWHRLAVAIEDAGLIIHPTIFGWAYSSGMPKATRVKGHKEFDGHRYGLQSLKPALEPIIVFQKPFNGPPLNNIIDTGAGTLNINAGRIPSEPYTINTWDDNAHPFGDGAGNPYTSRKTSGRWPANFILMDSEAASHLDRQSGNVSGGAYSPPKARRRNNGLGLGTTDERFGMSNAPDNYGDSGGASRFFFNVSEQLDEADPIYYGKKASKPEKNAGLDDENVHPTVKPINLSTYLAKLLLPPDEYAPRRILVPFSGVGSEMIGCALAGWEQIVGIEFDKENGYVDIAKKRIDYWCRNGRQ